MSSLIFYLAILTLFVSGQGGFQEREKGSGIIGKKEESGPIILSQSGINDLAANKRNIKDVTKPKTPDTTSSLKNCPSNFCDWLAAFYWSIHHCVTGKSNKGNAKKNGTNVDQISPPNNQNVKQPTTGTIIPNGKPTPSGKPYFKIDESSPGSNDQTKNPDKTKKPYPEIIHTHDGACTAHIYHGTEYTNDKELAQLDLTFQECINECLTMYYVVCRSVNFRISDKYCSFHSSGIINVQTNKEAQKPEKGTTHAYLVCDEPVVSQPMKCGLQSQKYEPVNLHPQTHRVIGGSNVGPHSWPWHVSVMAYNKIPVQQFSILCKPSRDCGGVIICDKLNEDCNSSKVVITAANCVTYFSTRCMRYNCLDVYQCKIFRDNSNHYYRYIYVLAGKNDMLRYEVGEQHRNNETVIAHPRYFRNGDIVHDIAIIILQEPLIFTETVRPICLPGPVTPPPTDKRCVTTGWGRSRIDDKDYMPNILQQLVTPVYEQSICRPRVSQPHNNPSMMLCAGDADGKTGACEKDSGGPLQCQEMGASQDKTWILYGIIPNFYYGECLEIYAPTLYIRVSKHVSWIKKKIEIIQKGGTIHQFQQK